VVDLPARPFAAAVSDDGRRVYVSMPRAGGRGVALVEDWQLRSVWWAPDPIAPRGLALTRSGRHLLAANSAGGLLVLDSERLAGGDPVVESLDVPGAGSMQVVLEPRQRLALVSDEDSATVSVFDFGDSLSGETPRASLLTRVPVPAAPVGLACMPDGAHVLVTSQAGVLSVLSVDRAAVIGSVPAGAAPVRVALSPGGETAWVTARGSNALLAFDTQAVLAGERRALRAAVSVGRAPVGVAVIGGGARVVVANSNRYTEDSADPQTLAVVDAGASPALLGLIPAGAFPRELTAMPDGETVLVTNVVSRNLQAVRVVR
jgi:DNA-binding beta-propeller fold protein YncE